MNITSIKALSDNYIWVMEEDLEIIVVDPGEAQGVLEHIDKKHVTLKAILLTHNHEDHTAGVKEIVEKYPVDVYGPEETAEFATKIVESGDNIELLGNTFTVHHTPGHTEGHISYYTDNIIFSGDALFPAGCGRVITGDYQAAYDSIQFFKSLPDSVQVYAGHEYSKKNLEFAHQLDEKDEEVFKALTQANNFDAYDMPSMPSNIANEKIVNPFFKAKDVTEFKEIRDKRDKF